MLRKFIRILLALYVMQSMQGLYAGELTSRESGKKYNLSICAVFSNKSTQLKEWLDHHRQLGVDHFYLYNLGSRDSSYRVLKPYINDGIVTLVNWPVTQPYQSTDALRWVLSTEVPAYENAVNFIARDETKWLAIMDVAEFLECPKGNIADLLQQYDNYAGISFLSPDLLEETGVDSSIFKKAYLSFLTHPQEKQIQKMIFKPDQCTGFTWPPYRCCFKPSQVCTEVGSQELRINIYNSEEYNLSYEKKDKYRASIEDSFWINRELAELRNEGTADATLKQPLYQPLPTFIKNLLCEKEYPW